jgi:type II secretory pathway component PulK
MAVGALAVITIVTLGFSFNMRAQYKTSLNYLTAIKAGYMAESGIERAVADLKADAKARFIYEKNNLNNVFNDWGASAAIMNMTLGDGAYSVAVEDEQSKININTASQALLENIGFTTAQASDIIAYITANGPFSIVEELRKIGSIDEDAYNKVAGYLTANSYCDPNCLGQSPVNVNTAADDVLKAVFKNLSNGTVTITSEDAKTLAEGMEAARPIGMWLAFNDAVDAALSDITKREIVKNNCNPNNDKSALASSATTELCFFSGGYYMIDSIGTIGKYTNRVKTIVKVYDMVNESTSADFSGGIFKNVNTSNAVGAGPIPNSVKIGYYDDFSSNNEWVLSGTASITGVLTTNSNDIATLNKNLDKYVLDGTELISVDVTPRNDGTTGFQALPHPFYTVSGPPIQTIEAKVVENRLQLTSMDCTATWDNLRLLTKTGNYITRSYTIPADAEKPAYTTPYSTTTRVDPTNYSSSIYLSFDSADANTIKIKANFDNPALSSSAMVLEDIWFTYLPKTKFLYRQEG